MLIKKPLLAYKLDAAAGELDRLRFPLVATPKLDGYRCLIINGEPVTRRYLPIPNSFTRESLKALELPDDLDGELMLADPNATFQDVGSAFSSYEGEPDFVYHVFDLVTRDGGGLAEPYSDRLLTLAKVCRRLKTPRVRYVTPAVIDDPGALIIYENMMLAAGHEGIMLRTLDSPYKCGRSTLREGYLMALKRWVSGEAVIIGFEEQMENTNEGERDAVGNLKRSRAKDGLVGKGTLGAFIVRGVVPGREDLGEQEFRVGTGKGLTDELRAEVWRHKARYLSRTISYQFQEKGTKELPRILTFRGFRGLEDM